MPGEPFVYAGQRVSHNQSALISFLKSKNIFWVRTNYWIGYRLAFESNEEIRFVVSGRPAQTRIAEYLREGIKEGLDTMPFVLVPAQAPMMERALQIVGTTYERAAASNYVILYNLKSVSQGLHRILPVHAKVEVPSQAQDAGLIIDGSPETRWGTGRHQEPGMKVRVTFDQPTTLRGLAYDLASWPHDYPRGLQIDLILQSGERHTLIDQESYVLIREYLETSTEVNFHFDPLNVVAVELTQLGTHPVFDWSIAELEFFD